MSPNTQQSMCEAQLLQPTGQLGTKLSGHRRTCSEPLPGLRNSETCLWSHSAQLLWQVWARKSGKMEEIRPHDSFNRLLMIGLQSEKEKKGLSGDSLKGKLKGLTDRRVTNERKTPTLRWRPWRAFYLLIRSNPTSVHQNIHMTSRQFTRADHARAGVHRKQIQSV